jgi:membrane protein implicated in regulation of membrane protease activity
VGILALGWGRPLGQGGSGGWDWWTIAGALTVFLVIATARRRPPLAVAVAVAAIGGLLLADLTEAWGVVPVWTTLLFIVLSRNLLRRRKHPQV